MTVLREYEDFCNTHRPRRALAKPRRSAHCQIASPTWSNFVRRRDRVGGVIREY
jgi:hypothetical protein